MDINIAKDCLYEDTDNYESVTEPEIEYQNRWSTFYSQVFKNKADGTYWRISWSRGSTEYQDEGIENVEFHRVFPKTKTITVYE